MWQSLSLKVYSTRQPSVLLSSTNLHSKCQVNFNNFMDNFSQEQFKYSKVFPNNDRFFKFGSGSVRRFSALMGTVQSKLFQLFLKNLIVIIFYSLLLYFSHGYYYIYIFFFFSRLLYFTYFYYIFPTFIIFYSLFYIFPTVIIQYFTHFYYIFLKVI